MPSEKTPFSREEIEELSKSIPTPFHIYNEHEIKKTARELRSAFSWVGDHSEGYQNFFAVKALPNPHILEILKKEGMGADCSSAPELTTADRVGISGEDIIYVDETNNIKAKLITKAIFKTVVVTLTENDIKNPS